jgi:hypothetical protein
MERLLLFLPQFIGDNAEKGLFCAAGIEKN